MTMYRSQHFCKLALITLIATLASPPVLADKPEWAGGGKGGKHGRQGDDRQEYRRDDDRGSGRHEQGGVSVQIRFGDNERRQVQDYYGPQFRSGKCPPGLAKKNNGCMPPGQAKKWNRGAPLPRDVQYYDLPRDLLIRLPVPPSGQRYVRIASDILLIAVGTNMVLDALEDIGR